MTKRKKKPKIKTDLKAKETKVEIAKSAQKDLDKAPDNIAEVARKWIASIQIKGRQAVAKEGGKSLHDEPLSGDMEGKRSIRLNKSWRLIYSEKDDKVNVVTVERVSKHDYKKRR